eukprot:2946793-Rhodomonas_salina.1
MLFCPRSSPIHIRHRGLLRLRPGLLSRAAEALRSRAQTSRHGCVTATAPGACCSGVRYS